MNTWTAEGLQEGPKVRVVTVARTYGAGGEQFAFKLAGELGFRYVDDEIIVSAANAAGVSPELIDRIEKEDISPASLLSAIHDYATDYELPDDTTEGRFDISHEFRQLIRDAIDAVADEGNAVIVAHGAGLQLAGEEMVLRVLVTGSPAGRARRIAERMQISEEEARALVDESDRQRRDFLQRFFWLDHELTDHYDLVINTDLIPPVLASQMIVGVVRGGV